LITEGDEIETPIASLSHRRTAYLDSLPEDPEDDELSELDPEPLEEADDFSRSSSTFPAILNVQKER